MLRNVLALIPPGAKSYLALAMMLSGLANCLMLAGAIYTLQVYDRVLASKSVATLMALSLLVAAAYICLSVVDVIRFRIMSRIAEWTDAELMPQMVRGAVASPMQSPLGNTDLQPIRDVDGLKAFLGGGGPIALFDLPWTPIYLALVFALSPSLAYATAGGMLVLVVMAVVAERRRQRYSAITLHATYEKSEALEIVHRAGPLLRVTGASPAMQSRVLEAHRAVEAARARASDAAQRHESLAKAFRLGLQSFLIGLGAYLAILGDITPGAMIAASIAASRALAPLEQAVVVWPAFSATCEIATHITAHLRRVSAASTQPPAPAPDSGLVLDRVSVHAAGTTKILLSEISLSIKPGTIVGLVGDSGAGKSVLAETLLGLRPILRGSIRLDGLEIGTAASSDFDERIGYLPDRIELYPGTIAQNIGRMAVSPDPSSVASAAAAVGAVDAIQRLPDGFQTIVDYSGRPLSGGERQLVGLARAFFANPSLVVLDMPSSQLDATGEDALKRALRDIRARGGIAIVIANRKSLLTIADLVVQLEKGRLARVVETAEIRSRSRAPDAASAAGAR